MPRVSRKDNPDYEQVETKNKNGVSTKRYRKKVAEAPKEKKTVKVEKKAPKEKKAPPVASVAKAQQQFAPPTDYQKPLTNPSTQVMEDKVALKFDVIEGLSQKEIDRMDRVKAKVKAIANIKANKANRS